MRIFNLKINISILHVNTSYVLKSNLPLRQIFTYHFLDADCWKMLAHWLSIWLKYLKPGNPNSAKMQIFKFNSIQFHFQIHALFVNLDSKKWKIAERKTQIHDKKCNCHQFRIKTELNTLIQKDAQGPLLRVLVRHLSYYSHFILENNNNLSTWVKNSSGKNTKKQGIINDTKKYRSYPGS